MKKKWRTMGAALTVLLLTQSLTVPVLAYFDRGPVTVTVGQTAVELKEGENATVSIQVTPASGSQLPGCGMAECPQTCGEKECLNGDGECMCSGLDYKTYYAGVETSTGNAGIATAGYSGGVLTILGIAPGQTTVTVTGMLRQYRQDSKTISVTVLAKAASAPQPSIPAEGTPADTAPVVKPVTPSTPIPTAEQTHLPTGTAPPAASLIPTATPIPTAVPAPTATSGATAAIPAASPEPKPEKNGERTVMSDRGLVIFVPIEEDVLMGKEQMRRFMGQQATLTFECKDTAGNVSYSWSFATQDIRTPMDMDLTIRTSQQGNEALRKAAENRKSLFLDLAHQGTLPGSATVCVRAEPAFATGAELRLYRFRSEDGKAALLAQGLKVENGYVSIDLEEGGTYFLTADGSGMAGYSVVIALAAVVLTAALAGGSFWYRRRSANR